MASTTGHLSSFVASWWQYNSSRVGVFTPAKCLLRVSGILESNTPCGFRYQRKGGTKPRLFCFQQTELIHLFPCATSCGDPLRGVSSVRPHTRKEVNHKTSILDKNGSTYLDSSRPRA